MSCTRSSAFALQPHQLFLKSAVPFVDRLLLFHGIGSGKTCSAISIAAAYRETVRNKNKIVVVVPASLRANFLKELKGPCGTQQRQTETFFDLMSYQGFVKRIKNKTLKLNNTLVIVDEVQNIVSETGSTYQVFQNAFQKMKNSKLIMLSATPMFDKTIEISLLGNLLLSKEEFDRYHLPLNPVAFSRLMNNPKVLYTFFKHRVSYFRGADPRAYPSKTEHRVDCVMSKFQRHVYMESIGHIDLVNMDKKLQRAFLIAPRQLSNLVLPNGNVGKLTNVKNTFNVKKFSTKIYKCIQKINESPGPVFVYSNFVTVSGIEAFTTILSKVYGFSDITQTRTPGPKYGVFRANKPKENEKLLALYNSPENRDGSLVRVIVGSPTMKEGVTLLRTRQIHILDPYWNRSRTEQIMGRGIRFCSHADLPTSERHVDVFHYYAVPSEKEKEVSVDLRILKLSNDKIRKINIVETILKETAVDCPLFKDRNEPPVLHCFNHDIVSDEERKRLMTIRNVNHNVKVKQSKPNQNLPVANASSRNNSGPSGATAGPGPSSLKKAKPMRFGERKKDSAAVKNKGSKSSCPSKRRVNPQTNECPISHPHKRPNAKGYICCFARAKGKRAEGIVKRCRTDQILNPRTKRCVLRNTKLGRALMLAAAQSQE